jgi:DNA processing protein
MANFFPSNRTDDQLARLAFLDVPGIGRQTIKRIEENALNSNFSLAEVWQKASQFGHLVGLTEQQSYAVLQWKKKLQVRDFYEGLRQKNIEVLFLEDTFYPHLLRQTLDPPLCLFIRGSVENFFFPPIAIVGTRKMTGYGRQVTEKFVRQLIPDNVCIVSGCMIGIDAIAHQSALNEKGKTIGVLGYGFDHVYPRKVAPLLDEMILSNQLLISEYPPATPPNKGSFPERNRIVAGLSLATIIPEAAEPSGSFITARCALEYGRPVCAVPGPITSIYSEGTKSLINQGAVCISSGKEVWKEVQEHHLWEIWQKNLPLEWRKKSISPNSALPDLKSTPYASVPEDPLQREVYHQLLAQPLSFNELLERTQFSFSQVMSALTMLEMTGFIRKDSDLWYLKNI